MPSAVECAKWKALGLCSQCGGTRHTPAEDEIKALLLECLEAHYGDLSKAVTQTGVAEKKLARIKEIIGE